jgi:hypothetical protein
MILRPWKPDQQAELNLDVEAYMEGRTSNGFTYEFRQFGLDGRVRLSEMPETAAKGPPRGPPNQGPTPLTLGFDLLWIDFNSADPGIPNRLTDQSIGLGFPAGSLEGWKLSGTAGFGYASNEVFGDGDGWYFMGDIVGEKSVGRGKSWVLALNFDGNRLIFPDLPLPYAAYTVAYGPVLRLTFGFPFISANWKPARRWSIEARVFLINVSGRVQYEVNEKVDLYLTIDRETQSFHIDGTDRNRRLFLRQRKLEAGVDWQAGRKWKITFGAGWAFDQEFSVGWDIRDLDTVASLSDEFYGAVRLTFDF